MANVMTAWNVIERTKVFDISYLPTRIQDIPKEVLRMYGIVVEDEEILIDDDDDPDEPGVLVIDEKEDEKPVLKLVFREKKTRKNKYSMSPPSEKYVPGGISYCYTCKKLISGYSPEDHSKQHCGFDGCPELVRDDEDRARHRKIHSHPNKPLQCRYCKKRYRYYSFVERHYLYCKAKKNRDYSKSLKGIKIPVVSL